MLTVDKKLLYEALVLSSASRTHLINVVEQIIVAGESNPFAYEENDIFFWFDREDYIAHHMTLAFWGGRSQAPSQGIFFNPPLREGEEISLLVKNFAINNKAAAVFVEISYNKNNFKIINQNPHITLKVNKSIGAKPKDSNNILSENGKLFRISNLILTANFEKIFGN